MERRFGIIITLLIVVASVLRLAGLFDDFWLDEIWSYEIAKRVQSVSDILLNPAARWDNNHPLNTLFIWILGEQPHWWIYRVPSLLAGIGSVGLVPVIMLRRGRAQALLATALVGLSYPLIFFSSEARGYSLVVFFALVAFDAVERFNGSARTAVLFAVACALGLLSHLSFIHVYVGLLAWSIYRTIRALPRPTAARDLLMLHAGPMACVAVIYLAFARHIRLGGAPNQTLWQGIAEAVAGLLALRGSDAFNTGITIAAAALLLWMLMTLRNRGVDLWIFLLVAIIISPVLVIGRQMMVLDPDRWQPIAPRYFLVLLPFVLLGFSILAPGLLKTNFTRSATITLLIAFFACSLWQTVQFLKVGRGHYSDTVIQMSQRWRGGVTTVLSDHPFRTGMVLQFYARLLPDPSKLVIYDATQDPPPPRPLGPPMWVIIHHNISNAPPTLQSPDYIFDHEATYYGLSGYCWYVYRRSDL